ncbi:MAG: glycosyltransferase family 2 protein [Acidimicrobiales bacterium]
MSTEPVVKERDESAKTATPPTVSIILPVLNEAPQLERCLASVAGQSYRAIVEIVVADGGSSDDTRSVVAGFPRVVVVDNPRRIRPAGLNAAIAAASGDIIVRVDARTAIAADYVEHCVAALEHSGAAIVGGQMRYEAHDARQRGIVAAMTSRIGAGPAAFRREGGEPRFVDTVYLGAYRASKIREMGGYDEWSGGNEDAELAWRAQGYGGVYLDPSIKSLYLGRDGLGPLARQFYRYGHNRARTIRKHPGSISYRQLAVPALFAGLVSPWRQQVLAVYVTVVLARGAIELASDPPAVPTLLASFPTMHAAWGLGFARGITRRPQGGQVAVSSMRSNDKCP